MNVLAMTPVSPADGRSRTARATKRIKPYDAKLQELVDLGSQLQKLYDSEKQRSITRADRDAWLEEYERVTARIQNASRDFARLHHEQQVERTNRQIRLRGRAAVLKAAV